MKELVKRYLTLLDDIQEYVNTVVTVGTVLTWRLGCFKGYKAVVTEVKWEIERYNYNTGIEVDPYICISVIVETLNYDKPKRHSYDLFHRCPRGLYSFEETYEKGI